MTNIISAKQARLRGQQSNARITAMVDRILSGVSGAIEQAISLDKDGIVLHMDESSGLTQLEARVVFKRVGDALNEMGYEVNIDEMSLSISWSEEAEFDGEIDDEDYFKPLNDMIEGIGAQLDEEERLEAILSQLQACRTPADFVFLMEQEKDLFAPLIEKFQKQSAAMRR